MAGFRSPAHRLGERLERAVYASRYARNGTAQPDARLSGRAPGIPDNRAIQEMLSSLELAPGIENLGDNLVRCYEELVRMNLVGKEEIPLVKAWVEDLAQLA